MNLAKHRKAAGLSQLQLARALGMRQRRTIGAWENNPDKVSLGNLKAYAEQCGVTLADLLGHNQETVAQDKLKRVFEAIDWTKEVMK